MLENYIVKISAIFLFFSCCLFLPSRVLSAELPISIPSEYFEVIPETNLEAYCLASPYFCGDRDSPVLVADYPPSMSSCPSLAGYSLLMCASENQAGYPSILALDIYSYSGYYHVRPYASGKNLVNVGGVNYSHICSKVAWYSLDTETWSSYPTISPYPTQPVLNKCDHASASIWSTLPVYKEFTSSLLGTNYESDFVGMADSAYFMANNAIMNAPYMPISGPPMVRPYTLEFFTEFYSYPQYIQATSDVACSVDLEGGLADYYPLECGSTVDFNLGDSSVPSVVITNNVYNIYIPDLSDPCSMIRSVNYSLFATDGSFLCQAHSSNLAYDNRVPDIPTIPLFDPEVEDWGVFDFLIAPVNAFLTVGNNITSFFNEIFETVLNWFLPNSDFFRFFASDISNALNLKIPLNEIGEIINQLKEKFESTDGVQDFTITSKVMGVDVNLVDFSLIDANIGLLRTILAVVVILLIVFSYVHVIVDVAQI